jgi:peroxidase
LIQNITFNEFLPKLVGVLPAYDGYKNDVETTIATEFSSCIFRIGHPMISSKLRINDNPDDFLLLRDAFFRPSYVQANGTENIIFGASQPLMKQINNQIIDDIRNFLFDPPTPSMLHDLAALNMQRGRDHGIPGYNFVREAYGLSKIDNFNQVISDSNIAIKLAELYVSPDNADPWVMAISEDHVPGLPVGPLIQAALKKQFLAIRDGDRFWFEVDPGLTSQWKTYIKNTTLGDIIRNNITVNNDLKTKVKKDVFVQ